MTEQMDREGGMGGGAKQPPRPATLRRDRVLDAASLCFLECGFYKTSVRQIAINADVSTGSIYQIFDDKSSLILAICVRNFNDIIYKVPNTEKMGKFDLQFIKKIARYMVEDLFDTAACRLFVIAVAEAERSPQIDYALNLMHTQLTEKVRALFCVALPDISSEEIEIRTEMLLYYIRGAAVHVGMSKNVNIDALRLAAETITKYLFSSFDSRTFDRY